MTEQKTLKFKEQVKKHFKMNGKWIRQAQKTYAFEAGKQWSDADMAAMKKQNRPTFVSNLVRPQDRKSVV